MPQTPISRSVLVNSTTPTTIYTVPTGATAIVKTLTVTGLLGAQQANSARYTAVKTSGGVDYLLNSQTLPYIETPPTFTGSTVTSTPQSAYNLLTGPITLSAGDSISAATYTNAAYKIPTSYSVTTTQAIGNIGFGNGVYIAVGASPSTGQGLVLTSPNGTTWTQQTFTPPDYLVDVVFGAGTWVAIGKALAAVYVSTNNGVTWTSVAISGTRALNKIEFINNTFVAVGANGQISHSTTPATSWTTVDITSGNLPNLSITDINFINSLYVISTSTASIYTNATLAATGWAAQANITGDIAGTGNVAFHSGSNQYWSLRNSQPFTTTSPTKPFVSSTLGAWAPTTATSSDTTGSGFTAIFPTNGFLNIINSTSGTIPYNLVSNAGGTSFSAQNYYTPTTRDSYRLQAVPQSQTNTRFFSVSNNLNNQVGTITPSGGSLVNASAAITPRNSGSGYTLNNSTVRFCVNNFDNTCLQLTSFTDGSGFYQNFATHSSFTSSGSFVERGSLYTGTNGHEQNQAVIGRHNEPGFLFANGGNSQRGIYLQEGTNNAVLLHNISDSLNFIGVATNFTGRIIFYDTNFNRFYISDNNFITFSIVQNPFSISPITNAGFVFQNNLFILTDQSNSRIIFSSDGFIWSSAPRNVFNLLTRNSLNLFVSSTDGTSSNADLAVTNYVRQSSLNLSNSSQLSLRNVEYLNGNFVVFSNGTIRTGPTLSVMSSNSLDINPVNNVNYLRTSAGNIEGLALATNGTNLVFASASPDATNIRADLAATTNLATTLQVGIINAGIVEIT